MRLRFELLISWWAGSRPPCGGWPHGSPVSLAGLVHRFTAAGVGEFVLFWPPEGREPELEKLAAEVIPTLRDRTVHPSSAGK